MAGAKSVFISYSSKDSRFALQVVRMLNEMGVSYWKAPEMIPAGSSYAREIPRAIRECEVFILLLSKDSQTSIWVEKEIDSAINNRKTILPMRIDEVPLCETFRFYLNNIQTISYKEDSGRNFSDLREQLGKLLHLENMKEKHIEEVEEYSVTKYKNLKSQNAQKSSQKKHLEGLGTQKQSSTRDTSGLRSGRRADAFVVNKAPKECKYCNGELKETGAGIFKCLACGKENYDYLRTVRNYLEKEGARPAAIIARETGVPKNAVDYFLRQEFLEIPKLAPERLSCQQCGAPIRTGYLCDNCKNPRSAGTDRNLRGKWYTDR